MTWVAAGVAGAGIVAGGVKTMIGNRKMKKLEKNRPQYEIPQEYNLNQQIAQQNLTDAQHAALQGIGEATKQDYLKNITRGQTSALESMSDRKSGLAGISDIAQAGNDAYGKLAAMDEQARSRNKENVFGARQFLAQQNQSLADQKAMQWQQNTFNPYANKVENAQGLISGGMNDIQQGLQTGAAGLSGLGGSGLSGLSKQNNSLTTKNKKYLTDITNRDNAETQMQKAPWG